MVAPLTRITVDSKVCGGQPCIRGLRVPVSLVLKHLAAGKTAEQVVDEFPELELEDIAECLRYAAWLVDPGRLAHSITAALRAATRDLEAGAIVTLDDAGIRIHDLPVG